REMDTKAMTQAAALKTLQVEIYVVGFEVCGTPNNNYCDSSIIGNNVADGTADQNLLKCIASSKPNTNDHYYETDDATSLPSIFQKIAHQIGHRLVE
ncbi:MAG TPA: hypothetical protein VH951_03325, partial [Dehalococcoidia bacterium]